MVSLEILLYMMYHCPYKKSLYNENIATNKCHELYNNRSKGPNNYEESSYFNVNSPLARENTKEPFNEYQRNTSFDKFPFRGTNLLDHCAPNSTPTMSLCKYHFGENTDSTICCDIIVWYQDMSPLNNCHLSHTRESLGVQTLIAHYDVFQINK